MKVCFLIPVWGQRYVDLLMNYTLRALLAPGNIPYLAGEGRCECLFLTNRESIAWIDNHPVATALRRHAKISFIDIGPLIFPPNRGLYGLTLAAAFGLGMRRRQTRRCDTWFVLLNADLIFSNNAGRLLTAKAREGYRAIACPGMRANDRAVYHALDQRWSGDEIDVSSRELVATAMTSPHLTYCAAFLNKFDISTQAVNKFIWHVDDKTAISRHFLRHPAFLCPETCFQYLECWCDYSFFPQLIPSQKIYSVQDSDEIFLLEASAADQEKELNIEGKLSATVLANQLSIWTTAEHRAFGSIDYVIHSDEIPANIEEERAAFNQQVSAITAHLTAEPQPWRGHPYWKFNWSAFRDENVELLRTLMDPVTRRDMPPRANRLAYSFVQRGEVERAKKQNRRAIAWYRLAAKISPRDPGIWSLLFMAYMAIGDMKGATRSIKKALALAPKDSNLLVQHGELAQRLEMWTVAASDFEAAGADGLDRPGLRAKEAALYAAWGDSLMKDEAAEAALERYAIGLTKSPDDVGLLSRRVNVKMHLGDSVGALADVETACALAPDDKNLGAQRAWVVEVLERRETTTATS